MGGACTSINKNKKIKSNEKDEEKKENENEEKKEEIKEDEIKEIKETEKELVVREITFKIINKDKEYTEKVKSSEKISFLFALIEKYKENKNSEYDLIYNEDISLASKLTEDIGSVFKEEENVTLNMLYMGLNISFDIKKDYESSNTLIGQPLFDLGGNIGLLIYHKTENNFTSEIVKSEKLLKYNHLSAFCNCNSNLYICGGESKENIGTNNRNFIPDFTKIDLFSPETINELPNLENPRAWHSMIFIPPKYIFIVGGDTKSVELFDIERQKVTLDSELNEIRNECTLFCLNDSILYAISGININGNYVKSIEKCNLRAAEREWKMVKLKKTEIQIQNCYYISSFGENSSSVILLAANENENHNYDSLIFEDGEEEGVLKQFNSNIKITDVCQDKSFHPLNDKKSIYIPLISYSVTAYIIGNDLKLEKKSFPDALKQIYD